MQDFPEGSYVVATNFPIDVSALVESLEEYDQFVCSVAEYRPQPLVAASLLTKVESTNGVSLSLALPAGATRRPTAACYAWDWPDSASMLLSLEPGGFPVVATRQATDVWWLSINGRPTRLTMMDRYADGRWYATIEGYLHDNLSILCIVGAETADRRNELIGAVATVRWKDDEVPAA